MTYTSRIYKVALFLCAVIIVAMPSRLKPVTSPGVEKTQNIQFEIEVIFSFGVKEAKTKSEEPYFFYYINNLDCDRNQYLYVLDQGECCIKVYDKNGKFTRKILGKGKGPQEISNVGQFRINQFSHHLFVMQDYGYTIKEFDLSGNYVKLYLLPQQYVFDFEFLDENRAAFIPRISPDDPSKYNFKLVNIKEKKIEKVFAETEEPNYLRFKQRFTIRNNTLWTVPPDQMSLIGFSLKTYNESTKIKIPGNFKKNTFIKKEISGGHSINPIIYNRAQPFFIDRHLFVLVYIQGYKVEKNKPSEFPFSSKLRLYYKNGNSLQEAATLKGCEFLELGAVSGNRLYFFTNDPYPLIKAVEIKMN